MEQDHLVNTTEQVVMSDEQAKTAKAEWEEKYIRDGVRRIEWNGSLDTYDATSTGALVGFMAGTAGAVMRFAGTENHKDALQAKSKDLSAQAEAQKTIIVLTQKNSHSKEATVATEQLGKTKKEIAKVDAALHDTPGAVSEVSGFFGIMAVGAVAGALVGNRILRLRTKHKVKQFKKIHGA